MNKISLLVFSTGVLFACMSDFDCDYGSQCVKKPYQSNGVCMQSVNRYGVQQYNPPKLESVQPRMNNDGCNFDTDCPIGFKCDLNYKVCIKR